MKALQRLFVLETPEKTCLTLFKFSVSLSFAQKTLKDLIMLTLVLGGARSGKSRYAESLCLKFQEVVYLATARVDKTDDEMNRRIARHRNDRSGHWKLVEEPLDPADYLRNTAADESVVLIDCVTVWLSNLMWEYRAESREAIENSVLQRVEEFAFAARNRQVVAVSNEVGGGIVPDNPLARTFRDVQGLANQILAREAERVVVVIAGLPLTLKG